MTNNKIALLLPTRERLNLKVTFLSSIICTADDINNVTVYFGVDKDDPTRDTTYRMARNLPWLKIIDIEPEGKNTNIHKIWNICARASTEPIISMVGDDMIFQTNGWDTKILNEFEKGNCPDDNIKMVYCYDGHRNGDLAVNAFLHRRYMDITGHFLSEDFTRNWADQWLHMVFTALGRLNYLPDVTIYHNHWVFGGRPIDKVGKELMDRDPDKSKSDAMWAPTEIKRYNEVKKIAELIGVKPDYVKAKFSRIYE